MRKKTLLFVVLMYLSLTTQAQAPNTASLRLYLGMEAANIVRPLEFREQGILKALSIRDVTEARPVLALAYMHTLKTGRYFEAGIRYDGPLDGNRNFIPLNSSTVFQGEPTLTYYNRTMQVFLETGRGFKVSGRKFKPYLGSFIRYSISKFDFDSQEAAFLSEERRHYNTQFGLTPRFTLPLGKRFDFDLSMPVQLFQLRFEYSKIENPALTPAQQESTSFELGIFSPLAQIRLGIGWKLNKPAEEDKK